MSVLCVMKTMRRPVLIGDAAEVHLGAVTPAFGGLAVIAGPRS